MNHISPKKHRTYIYNLLFPALIYATATGIGVGVCIVLFKFCAGRIMGISNQIYTYLQIHPAWITAAIVVLFGFATLYYTAFKRNPNLRGGGIPTSIGIMRGLYPFRWLSNLIGVFALSLCSFFIGVPLGTEGPSVQMGTAVGRGITRIGSRTAGAKHAAWDRYLMTAGASAGFCTATDAPISGMMFVIEEAHQRISPMIILVSTAAVTAAKVTSNLLSPLLGVNTYLFPSMRLIVLDIRDLWLPILIALAVGLFAVVFLRFYTVLHTVWQRTIRWSGARLPARIRAPLSGILPFFTVFLLTLGFGMLSDDHRSSGHHLIEELMHGHLFWLAIIGLVIVRMTIMILANSTGVTGGMFLPIMALGAMISSIIGSCLITHTPLTEGYYPIVVVLGITACIASMMKMPLTAITFAIEALSAHENIIPVLLVSVLSYFITELFGAESINEHVLENRLEAARNGKDPVLFDGYVTVHENTFAIGKQIRDIFWPANLFVLSVRHNPDACVEVDEHGGKTLHPGDLLHIRYSTYDQTETLTELFAIVGEQDMMPYETDENSTPAAKI